MASVCTVQGVRLERVWADLKLFWNKFHAARGGFIADDCQPNSAFRALSDETCLSTFVGFNNEDNELVKVLKALMMLQVCTSSIDFYCRLHARFKVCSIRQ